MLLVVAAINKDGHLLLIRSEKELLLVGANDLLFSHFSITITAILAILRPFKDHFRPFFGLFAVIFGPILEVLLNTLLLNKGSF